MGLRKLEREEKRKSKKEEKGNCSGMYREVMLELLSACWLEVAFWRWRVLLLVSRIRARGKCDRMSFVATQRRKKEPEGSMRSQMWCFTGHWNPLTEFQQPSVRGQGSYLVSHPLPHLPCVSERCLLTVLQDPWGLGWNMRMFDKFSGSPREGENLTGEEGAEKGNISLERSKHMGFLD